MQLNLFNYKQIKKCYCCKQIKEINNFYYKKTENLYSSICKKCDIIKSKQWAEKNPDKYKQKLKKWRFNNKDYIIIKSKQWAEKNREKVRELGRKSYQRNKNEIQKRRKNILKKRLLNDPVFTLKHRIRHSIRNNLKRGNNKYEDIIGLNYKLFKKYLFENCKTVNYKNLKDHHIDHIIPLKAAKTEFEVVALNHYTNLQLLTELENLKKGSKYKREDFDNYMSWYIKNVRTEEEYNSLTL